MTQTKLEACRHHILSKETLVLDQDQDHPIVENLHPEIDLHLPILLEEETEEDHGVDHEVDPEETRENLTEEEKDREIELVVEEVNLLEDQAGVDHVVPDEEILLVRYVCRISIPLFLDMYLTLSHDFHFSREIEEEVDREVTNDLLMDITDIPPILTIDHMIVLNPIMAEDHPFLTHHHHLDVGDVILHRAFLC